MYSFFINHSLKPIPRYVVIVILAIIFSCSVSHAASCSSTNLGNGVTCINSASALSTNNNTVSISGFNATGANFLVASVSQGTFAAVFCTPSDSSSNTWQAAPLQSNSTTGSQQQLFFAFNATVTASMTIFCNGSGGYPAISVAAFSGIYSAASPLDQSNGATTVNAFPTDDATLGTGSITGSNSNQLIVVGLTQLDNATVAIGSGFTLFESKTNGSSNFGTALAMKTVAAPTATSATWTPNVNFRASTTIASFATSALCTGGSPSWTAVSWSLVKNCHDLASNGDTITVASGTYSAKVNIQITKFVHVVAAGGGVTLTDDITTCAAVNPCGFGPTQTIITFNGQSAGSPSLEGFTINTGAANQVNPGGAIAAYGGGKPVVFKNNTINDSGAYGNFDWFYFHQNAGVVAHNTFNATPNGSNCNTQTQFLQVEPEQTSSDWATTVPFGNNDDGTNLVYIEGNTINHGGLTDNLSNGRTVYRYNTVTNTNISIHGIAFVDGRFIDVYNNHWIRDSSLNPGNCTGGVDQNFNGFLSIGAGVAYVHHNDIPSANTLAWGPKTAIQISADILTRNGGGWPCWNTFTGIGDGYPSPELPGWGNPGGVSLITTCPGCGPPSGGPQNQALDPMYFWANNYGSGVTPSLIAYDPNTPNEGGSTEGCATAGAPAPYPSIGSYIVEGREFYLEADAPSGKPGYTAFTCPHPLAGSGSCDPNTNGVGGYSLTGSPVQSFSSQPTNTTAGHNFSPTVTATVSPAATDSFTLSLAAACGTVSLTGTLTVTASAGGVATFTAVGVTGAGTGCVLNSHDNTNASVVDVTSTPFNVSAGNTLTFSTQPTNTASGANFSPTVVVTVSASVTDSITLSINACGASLSGTTTRSAVGGVATFTSLGVTTPTSGFCILTAHDNTDGTVTNITSNSFAVLCVPSKLIFTAQPQNAALGSSLGTVSVSVEDSGGNVCTSDTSTVTLTKHAGTCTSMTLNGAASGPASSGVFSTSTLNMTGQTGSCQLDAADGALTGATSSSFTISAAGGSSSQLNKKKKKRRVIDF